MNKSFNFQKSLLVLATAFCALSINVLAETYTVQVELNSTIGETPLEATQTRPMSYPVLKVDQATEEGANCVALSKVNETGYDGLPATNVNSLCPGGTASYAGVQFKGVPNAAISIEQVINIQEKNGLRFAHHDGTPFQQTFHIKLSDDEGIYRTGLSSSVTLVDKSQVTDAVMEFTYGISAAYQ